MGRALRDQAEGFILKTSNLEPRTFYAANTNLPPSIFRHAFCFYDNPKAYPAQANPDGNFPEQGNPDT
jgi:hypothetical protein